MQRTIAARHAVAPFHVSSPRHLARARVTELITNAAESDLTLIVSPGGRGVATALRDWSEQHDHATLIDGLHLGALSRKDFWVAVISRLADDGSRVTTEAFEDPRIPVPVAIAHGLAAMRDDHVIVINRLDLVPEADLIAADLVRLLSGNLPVRVIVSARDLTAVDLSAAPLHATMARIPASAFDLTNDEIRALAHEHGHELDDGAVGALAASTLGNTSLVAAAILYLGEDGAGPMPSQAMGAINAHLRDTVLEPWLERPDLPALLELSVPDRIDAEVAAALGVAPGHEALLDSLERASLGAWRHDTSAPTFVMDPLLRRCLDIEFADRNPVRRHEAQAVVVSHIADSDPVGALALARGFDDWSRIRRLVRSRFDDVVDDIVADGEFMKALVGARLHTVDPVIALVLGMHEADRGRLDRCTDALNGALRLVQRTLEWGPADLEPDELAWSHVVRFMAFSRLGLFDSAVKESAILERMLRADGVEEPLRPMRYTVHREIAEFLLRMCRYAGARRHLADARMGSRTSGPVLALTALEAALDGDIGRAAGLLADGGLIEARGRTGRLARTAALIVAMEQRDAGQVAVLEPRVRTELPVNEFWPVALVVTHGAPSSRPVIAEFDAVLASLGEFPPVPSSMHQELAARRIGLLMSLRRWREAFEAIERLDPPEEIPSAVVRARAAYLLGEHGRATVIAERYAWRDSVTIRDRAELLIVAAASSHLEGRTDVARERIDEALSLVRSMGLQTPLAAISATHLGELVPGLAAGEGWSLDLPPEVVRLSRRERAVFTELVATGSLSEIAAALSVSVNTVRSQLTSIYRKLGVTNRAEALSAAVGTERLVL